MKNSRWLLTPLAAVTFTLILACGGGSDDAGSVASGQSGAASPPQSPTGALALGNTLDVSYVAASLEQVESFRFDFKLNMDLDLGDGGDSEEDAFAAMFLAMLGNLEAEGAYVAPDRMAVKMDVFGMEVQTISIGAESWTNDGSGWVADSESTGMSFDVMPFDFSSPAGLPLEFLPDEVMQAADVKQERVNGFETTRYSFDKESLESLAATMGEQAGFGDTSDLDEMSLDIWVTGDGVPVKMLISASGQSDGSQMAIDLEFNIKDLNDDDISIESPI